MQFDADIGLDRLELSPVSKASTDQRAGRAGRTQPGICLRLWDEATQRRRADFEVAELHRVDLSSAVLRLYDWGETDIAAFPWFEVPPAASVEHAQNYSSFWERLTRAALPAWADSLYAFLSDRESPVCW